MGRHMYKVERIQMIEQGLRGAMVDELLHKVEKGKMRSETIEGP